MSRPTLDPPMSELRTSNLRLQRMHTSDSEFTQLGMGIRPIDSLGSSASTASNSTGSLSQGGSGGSLNNLEGVLGGGHAGGGHGAFTKGGPEEVPFQAPLARSQMELSKHGASPGWAAASLD